MLQELKEILGDMGNPHLKALTDRFFLDPPFIKSFSQAPAAKHFHHNYLGGLLEHTLSVCRAARRVGELYPRLDGDLLLAGAFVHDIASSVKQIVRKVMRFIFSTKLIINR